jgi:nucleotide-binding universal stress UspA family protein
MYILIPTDGSELARRAVQHGLSLAKSVLHSIHPPYAERHNRRASKVNAV